jgi:hypothetical protein
MHSLELQISSGQFPWVLNHFVYFCMLSPKCGLAWDRPITIFFSMRNLGAGRVTAAAKGSAATTLSEEWVALTKVREIYRPKFSILLFSHSSAALHGAGKKQKTWRTCNLQIAQQGRWFCFHCCKLNFAPLCILDHSLLGLGFRLRISQDSELSILICAQILPIGTNGSWFPHNAFDAHCLERLNVDYWSHRSHSRKVQTPASHIVLT